MTQRRHISQRVVRNRSPKVPKIGGRSEASVAAAGGGAPPRAQRAPDRADGEGLRLAGLASGAGGAGGRVRGGRGGVWGDGGPSGSGQRGEPGGGQAAAARGRVQLPAAHPARLRPAE